MNNANYEKTKKKVEDFYNHYKYLLDEINKTDIDSVVFKSFISNSMILKICELKKKEYRERLKDLKNNKVFDNLLVDSFVRKMKKLMIKISPKLYYKLTK